MAELTTGVSWQAVIAGAVVSLDIMIICQGNFRSM